MTVEEVRERAEKCRVLQSTASYYEWQTAAFTLYAEVLEHVRDNTTDDEIRPIILEAMTA